jgi:hypothetical protein
MRRSRREDARRQIQELAEDISRTMDGKSLDYSLSALAMIVSCCLSEIPGDFLENVEEFVRGVLSYRKSREK